MPSCTTCLRTVGGVGSTVLVSGRSMTHTQRWRVAIDTYDLLTVQSMGAFAPGMSRLCMLPRPCAMSFGKLVGEVCPICSGVRGAASTQPSTRPLPNTPCRKGPNLLSERHWKTPGSCQNAQQREQSSYRVSWLLQHHLRSVGGGARGRHTVVNISVNEDLSLLAKHSHQARLHTKPNS